MPVVSVWTHSGSNVWAFGGSFIAYTSLRWTPTFLGDGDWEMELPTGTAAEPLDDPAALATIDYRGVRSTWTVVPETSRDPETGDEILTIGGDGALSLLGWEAAWPDPTKNLANQPVQPVAVTGSAEAVVISLVRSNYVTRAGRPLFVPASLDRGSPSRARGKWTNLEEIVVTKAKAGGIGVDVGLVDRGDGTARLELRVWEPADLSGDVFLSELAGTLTNVATTITPPTLTEAIVSGAGGQYKIVTTAASNADAALFGGHRSALVAGPQSYDDADLQQAGEEALKDGAPRVDVALTAADTEGLQPFTDFNEGDMATAELGSGLSVVDVISSFGCSMEEGFVTVAPTFGDPASQEPLVGLAQLIRSTNRRLRAQEQKG